MGPRTNSQWAAGEGSGFDVDPAILKYGTWRCAEQEAVGLTGAARAFGMPAGDLTSAPGRSMIGLAERGTGRAVTLGKDGAPAEIVFWGYSGD